LIVNVIGAASDPLAHGAFDIDYDASCSVPKLG
jgi:hypothetical protein